KKRTIRDFYSLSPHLDDGASPGSDNVTPKKRRVTAKLVPLNDQAKPIRVHIPFGKDKYEEVVIESHCVGSRFDLGDEPLVLSGQYPGRSKASIERFLRGFGRYIH
ncbi:hypothetical protein ACHAWF_001379, partial [Thalassiosira exigua]